MRKQIPASKVNAVVSFSTKRPESRLNSIKAGLGVRSHQLLSVIGEETDSFPRF